MICTVKSKDFFNEKSNNRDCRGRNGTVERRGPGMMTFLIICVKELLRKHYKMDFLFLMRVLEQL
jgi:hypothetical protein